jgi:hypothetical protein
MDGSKSRFKDCLQQSKIGASLNFKIELWSLQMNPGPNSNCFRSFKWGQRPETAKEQQQQPRQHNLVSNNWFDKKLDSKPDKCCSESKHCDDKSNFWTIVAQRNDTTSNTDVTNILSTGKYIILLPGVWFTVFDWKILNKNCGRGEKAFFSVLFSRCGTQQG